MRASHPDAAQLTFIAVDVLHQTGVDVRGLALSRAHARLVDT
jgi:hypothetical protein